MSITNKMLVVCLALFGFIGESIFPDHGATAAVEAAEAPAQSTAAVSALELTGRSLNLISLSQVVAGGQKIGLVAVYDDPATRRTEDYVELYDSDGDLLVVGWFDRFGIQRIAMDRAVLEGESELHGVFVTVVDGESI